MRLDILHFDRICIYLASDPKAVVERADLRCRGIKHKRRKVGHRPEGPHARARDAPAIKEWERGSSIRALARAIGGSAGVEQVALWARKGREAGGRWHTDLAAAVAMAIAARDRDSHSLAMGSIEETRLNFIFS